jgi:hypothetical protein
MYLTPFPCRCFCSIRSSYRLCPAGEPLTEACFNKIHLDFNHDKQALLFKDGTRLPINGTFVSEGTFPPGSQWAMSPIPPRCLGGSCHEVDAAHAFCKECPLPIFSPEGIARDCTCCDNTPEAAFPPYCDETAKGHGQCSGNEAESSIIDSIKIPARSA